MQSLLFLITAIQAATIQFTGDWRIILDGAEVTKQPQRPFKGSSVDDMKRIHCQSDSNSRTGGESRSVLLYYINGATHTRINLGAKEGRATITNLQPGNLQIWFVCSSARGTTYDSDFRKDYYFNVQPWV